MAKLLQFNKSTLYIKKKHQWKGTLELSEQTKLTDDIRDYELFTEIVLVANYKHYLEIARLKRSL